MYRLYQLALRLVRSGTLFWLLALMLLIWLARSIPMSAVLDALRRLQIGQVLILVILNGVILLLLGGRWWVILRAQGYRIPYLKLSGYRLSVFSVSYFTPGPHFGGEPLQVYLPKDRDGVPGTTAAAAVALDKTLELFANFTVLALGAMVIVWLGLIPGSSNRNLVGLVFVLLALPGLYLVSVWAGRQPFTWFLRQLPIPDPFVLAVQSAEQQVSQFCRRRPHALAAATLFSAISWMMMLGEYWLMARFLGIPLTPIEAIASLTAARFAYLLPLPGGLGALEASQALAISALGYDAADGVALALLIRMRDVLMAVVGVVLLARMTKAPLRK